MKTGNVIHTGQQATKAALISYADEARGLLLLPLVVVACGMLLSCDTLTLHASL